MPKAYYTSYENNVQTRTWGRIASPPTIDDFALRRVQL